jgi:hypothetical protein
MKYDIDEMKYRLGGLTAPRPAVWRRLIPRRPGLSGRALAGKMIKFRRHRSRRHRRVPLSRSSRKTIRTAGCGHIQPLWASVCIYARARVCVCITHRRASAGDWPRRKSFASAKRDTRKREGCADPLFTVKRCSAERSCFCCVLSALLRISLFGLEFCESRRLWL